MEYDLTINQSINQSIDQLTSQTINRSISQSGDFPDSKSAVCLRPQLRTQSFRKGHILMLKGLAVPAVFVHNTIKKMKPKITKSINQSINQSIDRANQATKPVSKMKTPINESVDQSIDTLSTLDLTNKS